MILVILSTVPASATSKPVKVVFNDFALISAPQLASALSMPIQEGNSFKGTSVMANLFLIGRLMLFGITPTAAQVNVEKLTDLSFVGLGSLC